MGKLNAFVIQFNEIIKYAILAISDIIDFDSYVQMFPVFYHL